MLESRLSARFGGAAVPTGDEGETGAIEKHIQLMKSRTGNDITSFIKRKLTANKNQEVEEDTPLRNSLFKELRESEALDEDGLYSPDEAVPATT